MENKVEIIDNNITEDEKVILIKKLRFETGFGLMDCKRFLTQSDFDYNEVLVILNKFKSKIYLTQDGRK